MYMYACVPLMGKGCMYVVLISLKYLRRDIFICRNKNFKKNTGIYLFIIIIIIWIFINIQIIMIIIDYSTSWVPIRNICIH